MASDRIRTEVTDRVATITMDEPERMNPLDRDAYRAIVDGLDRAESADARCVVLEGAGEAFSSGFDVDGSLGSYDSVDEHARHIAEHEQELVRRLAGCPIPVVGKIDGPAIGDAAGIALACDVPLGSERTKVGFSHVHMGLTMDCGVSYFLPRLVGEGLAMELALTGEIVDAADALEYGLVNHVFPVEEFEAEADQIVRDIADGPPVALQHTKRLVSQGLNTSVEEALESEAIAQAIVTDTDDYDEGIAAVREDRDPEFCGH